MYNVIGIQFGLLSNVEKDRIAEIDVSNSGIKSNANALYDPRLGPTEPGTSCFECKKRDLECSGHWSKVVFPSPIPHPYYTDEIKMILQCVCLKCSNLLYGEAKMKLNNLDEYRGLQKLKCVYKQVLPMCENTVCSNCKSVIYKIINVDSKYKIEFYNHSNSKTQKVDLKYEKIYEIFKNISIESFNLLGFNESLINDPKYVTPIRVMSNHRHEMRPEDFFMTNMLIVPPSIRPQNVDNSHDDLTIGMSTIIKNIKAVNTAKNETLKQKAFEKLQSEVYTYMSQNPETAMGGKRIILTICQRLKGKEGQFRSCIESTRSDFGARTVIGPDTSLRVNEIGIPYAMTQITQPIRVAKFNIKYWNRILRDDIRQFLANDNKPAVVRKYTTHPPVKFMPVIQYISRDGKKFTINSKKFTLNYEKGIDSLIIGDILDVRLRDGMEVLFNRNPTIREESINGHIVKVHKDPHKKTVTLNPAVCTPYGADQQ